MSLMYPEEEDVTESVFFDDDEDPVRPVDEDWDDWGEDENDDYDETDRD